MYGSFLNAGAYVEWSGEQHIEIVTYFKFPCLFFIYLTEDSDSKKLTLEWFDCVVIRNQKYFLIKILFSSNLWLISQYCNSDRPSSSDVIKNNILL